MNASRVTKKRATLGAAGAGVVAGVVGLAVLAAPAGAGPAPSLPDVSAQSLVQSMMTADPVAFGGKVKLDNELGLPSIGGAMGGSMGGHGGTSPLASLASGTTKARVYSDGTGKLRVSRSAGNADQTVVADGTTVWLYDSSDRTVGKFPVSEKQARHAARQHASAVNPPSAAKTLVQKLRESSKVSVNGTASVAGRDAYELVLTPKPTEHTLIRQVRIAVDSQTRMPLRLDVYGNGTPDPVLRAGFTSLDIGKQDPSLFTFTPPDGATVTTHSGKEAPKQQDMAAAAKPQLVGDGWDTVLTGKLDKKALAGKSGETKGMDPQRVLSQVGEHVSGSWGEGWLIHAKIGNALITSDGRIAAGFVPKQQLVKALESH